MQQTVTETELPAAMNRKRWSGDPVTNPLDPCSYNKAEQVFANTTAAWKALDCDGDGNLTEVILTRK
ncbi:hypothetical protein MASR1M65_15480 [Saprospiraceae bacterium]